MNIGLKLLTADGKSLTTQYPAVQYTGDWQMVGGNGAYIAVTGGLTAGGWGPVTAVIEYDPASHIMPTDTPPDGVECYGRVRWLKDWQPTTPAERGARAAYDKARAAYAKARAAYDKAGGAYDKARAALLVAIRDAKGALPTGKDIKDCADIVRGDAKAGDKGGQDGN